MIILLLSQFAIIIVVCIVVSESPRRILRGWGRQALDSPIFLRLRPVFEAEEYQQRPPQAPEIPPPDILQLQLISCCPRQPGGKNIDSYYSVQ